MSLARLWREQQASELARMSERAVGTRSVMVGGMGQACLEQMSVAPAREEGMSEVKPGLQEPWVALLTSTSADTVSDMRRLPPRPQQRSIQSVRAQGLTTAESQTELGSASQSSQGTKERDQGLVTSDTSPAFTPETKLKKTPADKTSANDLPPQEDADRLLPSSSSVDFSNTSASAGIHTQSVSRMHQKQLDKLRAAEKTAEAEVMLALDDDDALEAFAARRRLLAAREKREMFEREIGVSGGRERDDGS